MKKLVILIGTLCLCLSPLLATAQECTDEALDAVLECSADTGLTSCLADSGCAEDNVNAEITVDYLLDTLLAACCVTPEEAAEDEADDSKSNKKAKKEARKARNCVKKLQKQLRSRSGKRILPPAIRQQMTVDLQEKIAEIKENGSCVLDDDSDDDTEEETQQ